MGCKNSTLSCGLSASDEQEKFSVECMDNPHPLNAVVVYGRDENPVQTHPPFPNQRVHNPRPVHATVVSVNDDEFPVQNHPPENQKPLLIISAEQPQGSVQCVDDPIPLNAAVVHGSDGYPVQNYPPVSVQCVDDPIPLNAVVVYGGDGDSAQNHPPIL